VKEERRHVDPREDVAEVSVGGRERHGSESVGLELRHGREGLDPFLGADVENRVGSTAAANSAAGSSDNCRLCDSRCLTTFGGRDPPQPAYAPARVSDFGILGHRRESSSASAPPKDSPATCGWFRPSACTNSARQSA
jgi:hypothetical protein